MPFEPKKRTRTETGENNNENMKVGFNDMINTGFALGSDVFFYKNTKLHTVMHQTNSSFRKVRMFLRVGIISFATTSKSQFNITYYMG